MFENGLGVVLRLIPNAVLKWLADFANGWPWLNKKVSAIMINGLINVCPHRPHPWSTAHDYVSWTSLSDHRWSGRHLPVSERATRPTPESLLELFKRFNNEQRYCSKSTCLFPAFAQYLTDGILRTKTVPKTAPADVQIQARKQNTSNHHLDMCMLYGRLQEHTDVLRLKSDSRNDRGRLKSQNINGEEFAPFLFDGTGIKNEFTCLDLPLGLEDFDQNTRSRLFAFGGDRTNSAPQVSMMNTLFLREHNRLARAISDDNSSWDDERVFQTTRNTVIVLFIKLVVEEYINHISQTPFRFVADPAVGFDAPWNKPNWITTEFSLLYRWHSLIPDYITWGGTKYFSLETFGNNQILIDAGLARSFVDLSTQRAGRIGALNTTAPLLFVEDLALKQDAICGLATYSDYRNLVGLPRPRTFEDISRDSRVVDILKKHYERPDTVDFYVGLFAEDPLDNSPLPPLMLRLVAVDAFSQAFTNPLLSKRVFNQDTFSATGWETLHNTNTLKDVLKRNTQENLDGKPIQLTRQGWAYS